MVSLSIVATPPHVYVAARSLLKSLYPATAGSVSITTCLPHVSDKTSRSSVESRALKLSFLYVGM